MSEWLGVRAFGGERPAFWQGAMTLRLLDLILRR